MRIANPTCPTRGEPKECSGSSLQVKEGRGMCWSNTEHGSGLGQSGSSGFNSTRNNSPEGIEEPGNYQHVQPCRIKRSLTMDHPQGSCSRVEPSQQFPHRTSACSHLQQLHKQRTSQKRRERVQTTGKQGTSKHCVHTAALLKIYL